MGTITIGHRSFETPVLIPSISSFETQLQPIDALLLQSTLQEPISLVSAYDVWLDRNKLPSVCKQFRRNGVLLLDSGGYESSRIGYYARDKHSDRWSFDRYAKIAKLDIYDFIFSYDYFLKKKETKSTFLKRIIREFRKHSDILDSRKLIPVIHLRTADGGRALNHQEAIELFGAVVTEFKCRFIAVPERELGSGITARGNLTRKIVSEIRKSSKDCSLHILGCGNLLSFSLLAVAGAMMCDGLEWCRTFAAENFHLHHFQQKDIFADPGLYIGDPLLESVMREVEDDYPTAVAVRNLLSFQSFTRNLHSRLSEKTVHEFVDKNFGGTAGRAIREFEI
jgi:queuine/archaeosine tRNA-ribosyltransferase